METNELANILRRMYGTAQKNEQAAMIHLFGIKYHQELKTLKIKDIVELSGLPISYETEVRKAMNLAKYVEIKLEYR